MKALLIYLAEALVCTGILTAAYRILLDRRVGFRICRAALFIVVIAGAVIPLLEIPVWPGEVIYLVQQPAAEQEETVTTPMTAAHKQRMRDAVMAIYIAGVALLLGGTARGCLQIRRMRRHGTLLTQRGSFRLVRTTATSAFTFFNTIYLPPLLQDPDLQAIVAHEMSHIRHRHTAERLAMKVLKALSWWNPFVWMASRSLVEVQEYEADHDVLNEGHDLSQYISAIFNTQFGYSPDIASGLRNSLTKKRFQMMTKRRGNRHALLRLAGTLPVIGLLVAGFSFTTRAAEIRYTSDEQPAAARQKEKKEFRITIDKEADSVALATSDAANADNMEITVNDTPIKGMTTVTITSRKAGKGNMAVAANGTTMKNVSTVTVTSDESEKGKKILIIDGKVIEEPAAAAKSPDGTGRQQDEENGQGQDNRKSDKAVKAVIRSQSGDTTEPLDRPLVYLDGKEIDVSEMEKIDPNTIERINVLKEKSAIAKYGKKGENGVILIYLKKPEPSEQ